MSKSSRLRKPRPDFPLFPHRTGRWTKKVRGRFVYFGKVADDPDGSKALELWLNQKDDLLAGRTPRKPGDCLTVAALCNQFLTVKRQHVDAGELSVGSWSDYYATCERFVKAFGKNRAVVDLRPEDFQRLRASLAKQFGIFRLSNEIQRTRTLLKWAFESELIDRPVKTGPDFKKPPKHVFRKARNEAAPRLIEAADLRKLIEAAPLQLRAMIYLGVNCGLGNHDCGCLRKRNLDLNAGWLNYPRPKTGINRRCPLWPETVSALREAIAARPKSNDVANNELVFITEAGEAWTSDAKIRPDGKIGPRVDCVTQRFRTLLDQLELHRPRLGFYTLRHIFETIAGGTADQVAVDAIMGHADDSMAAHYREAIDDSRLKAVTDHVRKWLINL